MRMIHTSDWHLGRTFHGHSLLPDQEQVLVAVVELAVEHAVDVVVISGDLYDRAVPAPEAVQCATRILGRIRAAGISIVAISGNHDSAPRLGAFTEFLAAGGLHLRTAPSGVGDPVVLFDAAGPVAFYPIPYLEPDLARGAWGLPGPASHQAVLGAAVAQARADLRTRPPGTRSVVVAHAFVVGASVGGSERSIAVGGVESVTAEVFDGFDYVALGHLHSPQVVSDRVRYSGSPLPYSFAEAGQPKGVWLVDLDAAGAVAARRIDLPVIRPLAVVRGTLAEVLGAGTALAESYLCVELTEMVRPLDPMRRLREIFPHTLVAQWVPDTVHPDPRRSGDASGVDRGDGQLLIDFVRDVRGSGPTAGERALLEASLAAHRALERTP